MAKANPKLNKLRNILLAVIPALVVFGLVFAANTYYDLDLQKVVIEEVTKIVGQLETTSTTTLATSEGNVGVGTTTPAYTLDIYGTSSMLGFRMSTGASSTYVLTSDDSGVGTWAEAPGIAEYARTATKVVCATDTLDTTNCDYLCDGANDEEQINAPG